jgi:hypothetical protein
VSSFLGFKFGNASNFNSKSIPNLRSSYKEICSSLQTIQFHILFENFQARKFYLLIESIQICLNNFEEIENYIVLSGGPHARTPPPLFFFLAQHDNEHHPTPSASATPGASHRIPPPQLRHTSRHMTIS